MGTDHEQPAVSLSLMERLTDLQPDSQQEAVSSSWQNMRELKASLCRDLASLLNTRRAEEPVDPAYEHARNSLLSFGVADFTSYNLMNGIEQELVRRSIERAIRQFEPRLSNVTVVMEQVDSVRPVLRFQIDAVLTLQPASETLLFDVTLHRDSRRIAVSGAN